MKIKIKELNIAGWNLKMKKNRQNLHRAEDEIIINEIQFKLKEISFVFSNFRNI